jgi:hypothetical protein
VRTLYPFAAPDKEARSTSRRRPAQRSHGDAEHRKTRSTMADQSLALTFDARAFVVDADLQERRDLYTIEFARLE